MEKQQDAIRAMASKKLLNGEQKKVLYKLFEARINAIARKRDNEAIKQRDSFVDGLLAKARKSEVGRLEKRYHSLMDEMEATEKKIGTMGFYLQGYGEKKLSISSDNKDLLKFEAKKREGEIKIEELKLKLLSDIHGLPMTYEELNSYLEKEIAKIDN